MLRLKNILIRRPWLLFCVGPVLVFVFSCLQLCGYMLLLIDKEEADGLALFDPFLVFPLSLLDYTCLLCVIAYFAFPKAGIKVFIGLLLLFRLANFYYFLSTAGLVWNLSDFVFRGVVGTSFSFLLVLLFSGMVLVSEKRARYAARIAAQISAPE